MTSFSSSMLFLFYQSIVTYEIYSLYIFQIKCFIKCYV
ncbi:hypothetical protein F3D3_4280 [Fusibacter sp. 3D3]|nr:hypothetical protein F3D3_4280 [Fusibacter sp. 3D3]